MAAAVLSDAVKNVAMSTLTEIAAHNTKAADFLKTVKADVAKIQAFINAHMAFLKVLLDALKPFIIAAEAALRLWLSASCPAILPVYDWAVAQINAEL
jgi:hypothetical protein